jgi:hypothetical protein
MHYLLGTDNTIEDKPSYNQLSSAKLDCMSLWNFAPPDTTCYVYEVGDGDTTPQRVYGIGPFGVRLEAPFL